jgi:DNA-binding GntR family transcriptional regulator
MTRLSDRLREAVEEEIATGRLLPGSRLDEVELARRFDVSRTPIREALNLLDALCEGDAEKAVLSVRNHVIVQGERFADLVSSLSRLDAPAVGAEPEVGPALAV